MSTSLLGRRAVRDHHLWLLVARARSASHPSLFLSVAVPSRPALHGAALARVVLGNHCLDVLICDAFGGGSVGGEVP